MRQGTHRQTRCRLPHTTDRREIQRRVETGNCPRRRMETALMHVQPDSSLTKLASKEAFQQFAKGATDKWNAIWADPNTVVTVGIGSSSIAKGAEAVLQA